MHQISHGCVRTGPGGLIVGETHRNWIAGIGRFFIVSVVTLLSTLSTATAQGRGDLTGVVRDQFGAVIFQAAVTVTIDSGAAKKTMTDVQGRYLFAGLPAGTWVLHVEAKGFAKFEKAGVKIVAGKRSEVDAQLAVGFEEQEITVDETKQLNSNATENRSALVLRQEQFEALPDDPEELGAALQALAGMPSGPNGAQIVIDGMVNNATRLPTKSTILEVRINSNPFSAENDRIGFGQIQIITRPGTEKLRGQGYFNFNDESLDSRNPFVQRKAPYQLRNFGGTIGGPIIKNRASFFSAVDQRQLSDNAIINAIVLGPAFVPESVIRSVSVPRDLVNLSTRLDVLLNQNHTLTFRYNYFRNHTQNAGVGGLALEERAFGFRLPIQTLQVSESAVLSNHMINELRIQYISEDQINKPQSIDPAVDVLGAFAAGGSPTGQSRNPEGRLTIQDAVLWAAGRHTLRAGARVRQTRILDVSPDNFNGSFTFAGGIAPVLDAHGEPVYDSQGELLTTSISSIERYRRTLFFDQEGLSPENIRLLGGGATQLIVGGGNPKASARQFDFGAYFQDDWRVIPTVTLNLGVRMESQTNIPFALNFAPRFSFGWALDGPQSKSPKAIIRGGAGIFFDRFNENQVLIANRFSVGEFLQFVITDPALLDLYPQVPPIAELAASSLATAKYQIAADLRVPYMVQGAIGFERRLPRLTTLTVSYIGSRTQHALRSRNINAPVIIRTASGEVISRKRPLGSTGEIFQYESSGRLNQNQLFVTLNSRPSRRLTYFVNYALTKAMGDTEGVRTTPAESYDLSSEYGDSLFDARHTLSAGGTYEGPFGLKFSPLIFASSSRPFNITTGIDINEDSTFSDRPGLAATETVGNVRVTPFGVFDLSPTAQAPIPRNFARGARYFIVHVNVSRTFAFGTIRKSSSGTSAAAAADNKYKLSLGVRIVNLFNNVNLDLPTGNLSSPFFGQPTSTSGGFGPASIGNPSAGNRRIEAQLRFDF
jgi:carboxypeptidase family protein